MMGGKKKEELYDEFDKKMDTVFHPILAALEKQLSEDGGPYIAGKKLTIADCCFAALMCNTVQNEAGPWFERFKPVLAKYPKILAYFGKLRETFKDRINDPSRKPMPL